ncbi:hypothetical protein RhiXN_01492 [Rhizoctonia solani]|uniref:BRCT domain-containing protein n=1 Tax=Rhizoctonia solani TaxID=456999 RepID=A0A8H8PBH9_9AGAM|nr:uncharacterized protein RhiXN_01492 [Rhizoctonia solani]QRW26897.1 hypothetical protein RhiXN_01492 [Rhizoctonia solani]
MAAGLAPMTDMGLEDISMDESLLLADLSNVSQDESQQINTQTRAVVYWAANKGVTSQQVKELYQIAQSPQPQQNPHPSPPSSSSTTTPKLPELGPSDEKGVDSPVDSTRTASCRKRNTAPRPISMPLFQSPTHQSTHKRTMTDDTGDYWYRTSADVTRMLGPEASSTPPRSQSRSQSQSCKQSQLKPPIQSPPASPPRLPGTGLVKQFSQLSTSETSQERGTVLVPGSSDESNTQPGTTQIVDYPFEHLVQADASDQTISHSRLIPSNELFFQRTQSPPFNIHQRARSPSSSPSLGASPRRVFGDINKGGGSSPPASSAMPTQDPDLNSQTTGMVVDPDGTGEGGSLDTQATAPTQLDPTQLKYISATPVISGGLLAVDQSQETPPTGLEELNSESRSLTPPTQIHRAGTRFRTSPPPTTPLRLQDSSRDVLGNSVTIHSVSPRRAFTTPLTHPNSNPHKLDRSRKSSFAPPVRTRPDAQRPLPSLNTGSAPLQSTRSRWDAKRAEEEEREARMTATTIPLPPRTPSPRRPRAPPTTIGIGTQDVLTESTPFVSGRGGIRTPKVNSPLFSPMKTGVSDDPVSDEDDPLTEPEANNPEPSKPPGSISHRGSSLPLESGRAARQKAKQRENDVREQSESEQESEDDATPQRSIKPSRGGSTTRRGRGRGRGRGRSVANTPRTPYEAQPEPKSPVRTTSTGKKRARGDMPREKSPAPAKRHKVKQAPSSAAPASSSLTGTRVLAWWHGGNYFFGSIVSEESKGRWEIGFDDSSSSKVPITRIRRAILQVGDSIQVNSGGDLMVDATVVSVANWETKRQARVLMVHDGKEVRRDVESRVISIPSKIVSKSWGDRMFEVSPAPPIKRKGVFSHSGTVSKTGSELTGYAFVLTIKAEDVGVGEKELEGWKVKLRTKIEGHGGTVVDEWDELFSIRGRADANGWYAEEMALHYVGGSSWPDVRKVFLLSGRMGTTPKYLMALALGVPCLSYKWVDEFLQDDTSQWMDALLPRGMSEFYQTEISQVVDPQLQSTTNMVETLLTSSVTRKPFKGSSVLCIFKRAKKIQPEGIDKGKFYSRVACVMGASTVHLVPDNDLNSLVLPQPILEYDYVNNSRAQSVAERVGNFQASVATVSQIATPPALKPAPDHISLDFLIHNDVQHSLNWKANQPFFMRSRRFPLARQRRMRLICCSFILLVTSTVLLLSWRSKSEPILVQNYLVPVKPPLIDRAWMERLGMYDEPEPVDVEWMGSLATNALRTLRVTQLPDSNSVKQNKNKIISNSLADWNLCEFRGRQCRVLLPVSIGEQESKAQLHLQQTRVVNPTRSKRREPFRFSKMGGDKKVGPESASNRDRTRGQPSGENSNKSIAELGDVSNGPSWRRCLSKSTSRLDFSEFKIQLAQSSTRSTELAEFGEHIIQTLQPIVDTEEIQVYALDWSLRHPIFREAAFRYLVYSKRILDYAEKLLDAAGPTVVVQWRMESVRPENLLACSSSLITLLRLTLAQAEYSDVKTVYLATDYPLEGANAPHSGTFRTIGDQHHAAILEFLNAFQPRGSLEMYRLTHQTKLSRVTEYDKGLVENDLGFLGIVDNRFTTSRIIR